MRDIPREIAGESLLLESVQNLLESGFTANRIKLMIVLEFSRARKPFPYGVVQRFDRVPLVAAKRVSASEVVEDAPIVRHDLRVGREVRGCKIILLRLNQEHRLFEGRNGEFVQYTASKCALR